MSDGTPRDSRPRPKYGEYASPQDQAQAIAGSLPPVSPLLTPPSAGGVRPDSDWPPPAPEQARPERTHNRTGAVPGDAPPASAARPRRVWDVAISITLLAAGLYLVLTSFPALADLGALLDRMYATQGIGDFSSDSLASTVGVVLNLVNVALLVLTTALTVRLLRARRLSFWVPLVGGVLGAVILLAALSVVVASDPAYLEYVMDRA